MSVVNNVAINIWEHLGTSRNIWDHLGTLIRLDGNTQSYMSGWDGLDGITETLTH